MAKKKEDAYTPSKDDLVTFNGENAIIRYVHPSGKVDVELTDRTDNGIPIWTPQVDPEKVTSREPQKASE